MKIYVFHSGVIDINTEKTNVIYTVCFPHQLILVYMPHIDVLIPDTDPNNLEEMILLLSKKNFGKEIAKGTLDICDADDEKYKEIVDDFSSLKGGVNRRLYYQFQEFFDELTN